MRQAELVSVVNRDSNPKIRMTEMDKKEVFDKIENLQNLPTLPVIISRLNAAVEDPSVNAEVISGIIKDDPAMMARILKTVNSVFYGVAQPVSSIAQAVSLLGFVAIKNIAITTAAFSTFDIKEQADFSREEFWKHSINVGIATNVIYDYVKDKIQAKISKDILHLAGLLHGIGIIIFEQFFRIKFMVALLVSKKENIPILKAEEETFSTNHCEVGAWLGKRWNLPEPIIESIRWHYSPENSKAVYKDLVNIAHTAKFICVLEKLGDFGESLSPFKQPILKELGLSVTDIPIVVDKIKEESKNSETMMTILRP